MKIFPMFTLCRACVVYAVLWMERDNEVSMGSGVEHCVSYRGSDLACWINRHRLRIWSVMTLRARCSLDGFNTANSIRACNVISTWPSVDMLPTNNCLVTKGKKRAQASPGIAKGQIHYHQNTLPLEGAWMGTLLFISHPSFPWEKTVQSQRGKGTS